MLWKPWTMAHRIPLLCQRIPGIYLTVILLFKRTSALQDPILRKHWVAQEIGESLKISLLCHIKDWALMIIKLTTCKLALITIMVNTSVPKEDQLLLFNPQNKVRSKIIWLRFQPRMTIFQTTIRTPLVTRISSLPWKMFNTHRPLK